MKKFVLYIAVLFLINSIFALGSCKAKGLELEPVLVHVQETETGETVVYNGKSVAEVERKFSKVDKATDITSGKIFFTTNSGLAQLSDGNYAQPAAVTTPELAGEFIFSFDGKFPSGNDSQKASPGQLLNPADLVRNGNRRLFVYYREGLFTSFAASFSLNIQLAGNDPTEPEEPTDPEKPVDPSNLSIEMVLVEGGTFQMGQSDISNATPVHTVTVSSFYIGKYEVTQSEYEAVIGSNPSHTSYGIGDNYPVNQVSWYEMVEYCNKLSIKEDLTPCYTIDKENQDPNNTNSSDTVKWTVTCNFDANGYRLPTEAEWEFAARGGNSSNGYTYSGSNTLSAVGWYTDNSNTGDGKKSHPVGHKAANELGIYDMSGNVWEWCWDWYDGSYSSGSVSDPVGVSSGSSRVSRGGSWYNSSSYCRVADRTNDFPCYRNLNIGFRLVRRPSSQDTIPPANPTSFVVTSKPESLQVTWIDPTDLDFDHVEISYTPDGGDAVTVTKGVETYTITGLTAGQSYTVTVKSVDGSGNKSSGVVRSCSPEDSTPPAYPLNVTVIAKPVSLQVTWTDPTDLDFDHVEISYTPDGGDAVTVTKGVETYTITGLTAGQSYTVTVKSVDGSGNKSSGVVRSVVPLEWNSEIEMVLVEGGTFQMGSNVNPNEQPIHTVTVSSFYIGKYEVTQGNYQALIGSNPSDSSYSIGELYPVNQVTWYDMIEYCNKLSLKNGYTPCYTIDKDHQDPNNMNGEDLLKWKVSCNFVADGYRLPTEAEWAFAAKGGNSSNNYIYSGSNTLGDVGWYVENSDTGDGQDFHPVGQKSPNELGIYDMSGNIWELCWDWYDSSFDTVSSLNPRGVLSGSGRVRRGGHWDYGSDACRIANRYFMRPDELVNFIGFRLVRRPKSLDTTPPLNSTNVIVTPKPYGLDLTWNDPSDEDFDHIELSYSPDGNDLITVLKGVETYSLIGLTVGQIYNITIKSVDFAGNKSSGVVKSGEPTIAFNHEMVFLEGSSFQMGSSVGNDNEKPVHSVTLSSFYIGKYEVTQKEYQDIMNDNPSDTNCRFGDSYPVNSVSWYKAVEFCNKLSEEQGLVKCYTIDKVTQDSNNLNTSDNMKWTVTCNFNVNGYRLPTEAEWEYAARGGIHKQSYIYSGSNNLFNVAWFEDNSNFDGINSCQHVGKKSPNLLGLFDMSGNLFEWCWDWSSDYESESVTNPKGRSFGAGRIIRGGAWEFSSDYCRVTSRSGNAPHGGGANCGFRLVRSM